jgi:hypothetical protein
VEEETIGNTRVSPKSRARGSNSGNRSNKGAVIELGGREFCCKGVSLAVVNPTDCCGLAGLVTKNVVAGAGLMVKVAVLVVIGTTNSGVCRAGAVVSIGPDEFPATEDDALSPDEFPVIEDDALRESVVVGTLMAKEGTTRRLSTV